MAAARHLKSGFSGVRWPLWEEIDQARRQLGIVLDALGLGPVETPSRVVLGKPVITLKAYADAGAGGPVVLLVPAPIKRAYIWDLVPWASVVRQCLRHGTRVYLIQWEAPGAAEERFGLADYADRLILDCMIAIEAESGRQGAFLAGHSLGGTLAAIFAALHPERVQGLVLLGAPLHFGPDTGPFGAMAELAPPPQAATALLGNVPGSVLDAVSAFAAPLTFHWLRWQDWFRSLPYARDRELHLRVERWTLDEMRLARGLFDDIVGLLYGEDRFMRGSLLVRGRRAAPELVKAPLLSVVHPDCVVAPPRSVLPFNQAVSSAETEVLWYGGDTGVVIQHLGMLVGESAHRELWPEILRWVRASDMARSRSAACSGVKSRCASPSSS